LYKIFFNTQFLKAEMWATSNLRQNRRMKGAGWVHVSDKPSILDRILAIWTLFMLFFVTLLYAVLIPLFVYLIWIYKSFVGAIVLFIVTSSPFWASGHWRAFGNTFGFRAWRKYFELRVYKEELFKQSKNVLLCFAPHGLFPLVLPMLSEPTYDIFPEFNERTPNMAIADCMFWTPILSPLLTWLGCISAKKEVMRTHLRYNNVMVLPDGIAGAFHSRREEECVYISKRKGFIRLAIEEGSLLVPIYCFGHSQLYDVYPGHDSWLASISRRFQFSLIWFWGIWWCPPMPHRVPMLVAIGKGIKVVKRTNPTQEEVDAVHEMFVYALKDLYNRHREGVPGYENKELKIL